MLLVGNHIEKKTMGETYHSRIFIMLSAEHIPLLIHTGSGGKRTARRARKKVPHIFG